MMGGCMFNIDGGYLEGLCRGFKCGILKQTDYLNLVQCETLEGNYVMYYIFLFQLLYCLFMQLILVLINCLISSEMMMKVHLLNFGLVRVLNFYYLIA